MPSKVTVSPDVLFQEVEDGEAILLNLQNESYFGLDRVATRMWQLLQRDGEMERVIARMLSEYDVDETRLRSDLARLIARLEEAGLVSVIC
jgi:hypothetical protein